MPRPPWCIQLVATPTRIRSISRASMRIQNPARGSVATSSILAMWPAGAPGGGGGGIAPAAAASSVSVLWTAGSAAALAVHDGGGLPRPQYLPGRRSRLHRWCRCRWCWVRLLRASPASPASA